MPLLFEEFVVLKPNMLMDRLSVSPELYDSLDSRYKGFKEHVLISAYYFSENWPEWENHPKGDELVVLMSGRAEFKMKTSRGERSILLESPGEILIVPGNTWHTALINEPTSMLFITPGEGTLSGEPPVIENLNHGIESR
ncbi:MAG: cupin [Gammaproteobacteria bacterium]|nr:cupin [Gammaproteobacteria bacterium]MCY4358052.1 cupin [Gammaproteobacteria bacterium]